MIQSAESPRFDINEVLQRVGGKPQPYFANYWQRILSVAIRQLNILIGSRNTGITGAIATGTVVLHGMGRIPVFVTLSPRDGTPTNYYADTITATQFTIHFTGGGSHIFGWSAET